MPARSKQPRIAVIGNQQQNEGENEGKSSNSCNLLIDTQVQIMNKIWRKEINGESISHIFEYSNQLKLSKRARIQ